MPRALDVGAFASDHPDINAALFEEHIRVALAEHHKPPADATITLVDPTNSKKEIDVISATIQFAAPDSRSSLSLQRPDFIEKGAIVLAGVILAAFRHNRITRVVPRGTRVDYFVGTDAEKLQCVLEVGGTDEQRLNDVRSKKKAQLKDSCYLKPPFCKDGYVSATHFAGPRCESVLEYVPYAEDA